jgi:hypothetical protein
MTQMIRALKRVDLHLIIFWNLRNQERVLWFLRLSEVS